MWGDVLSVASGAVFGVAVAWTSVPRGRPWWTLVLFVALGFGVVGLMMLGAPVSWYAWILALAASLAGQFLYAGYLWRVHLPVGFGYWELVWLDARDRQYLLGLYMELTDPDCGKEW